MKEINTFIEKDTFKNLSGCILIVELFTECIKYLIPSINSLCICFLFSCLVSFIRFLFNNDYSRDTMILYAINTIPIFLGSVGIYQVGIKPIEKLLN